MHLVDEAFLRSDHLGLQSHLVCPVGFHQICSPSRFSSHYSCCSTVRTYSSSSVGVETGERDGDSFGYGEEYHQRTSNKAETNLPTRRSVENEVDLMDTRQIRPGDHSGFILVCSVHRDTLGFEEAESSSTTMLSRLADFLFPCKYSS